MSAEKDTDVWVIGSKYAQLLGAAPSSFTTLIRGLVNDQSKNNNEISFHNQQSMVRFLRGESMQAPFYYILKTFKSEMLKGSPIAPRDVVTAFKPFELAACLALLYTYRRVRGLVKDEQEWKYLSEPVHPRSELGAFVGQAITNIGPGTGMLAGSIGFLARAAFLLHDQKGYIDYRRHLKKHDLLADLEYELKRWGCTYSNVAAHILISLGFSKETAIPFGLGLGLSELPKESNSQYTYAVKLVEVWTTALLDNGRPPEIRHSGNFYPVASALQLLTEQAGYIKSSGSHFHWLERQKKDINPESTPEFCCPETKKSGDSHEQQEGADDLDEIIA